MCCSKLQYTVVYVSVLQCLQRAAAITGDTDDETCQNFPRTPDVYIYVYEYVFVDIHMHTYSSIYL